MKILIVLVRLKGGVGRANTEIAQVLRKKGHQVDILSREDDLKIFSLGKSINPLRKKIRALMKKHQYDIIYTQDYSCAIPLLFPYKIFWKKHFSCFCGVKSGSHPELVQWHQKLMQRTTGKTMGKKLVVIGDELKEIFPKSTKIYRGVNVDTFRPLKKKRDALGFIPKAYEEITSEALERIAKEAKLKFTEAKNIPPHKMNEFYNQCKVFVDLPWTAGFNLAWLEAMAAGVPIIIGNSRGAGRFLPFDKAEGDQRSAKIKEIVKKPKSMNYRKWILDNKFSWEDKSLELINYFNSMIKKQKIRK